MAYLDSNEPFQRVDGTGFAIGGVLGAGVAGGIHYTTRRRLNALQERANKIMNKVEDQRIRNIDNLKEQYTNRMLDNPDNFVDNTTSIYDEHNKKLEKNNLNAKARTKRIQAAVDKSLSSRIYNKGFSSKGRAGLVYGAGVLGLGLLGGLLGDNEE